MSQLEGYIKPGDEDVVCRLKKSIYGLKQSPHCWNRALSGYLESAGFSYSRADPCVFLRTADSVVVIAAYVDDFATHHNRRYG